MVDPHTLREWLGLVLECGILLVLIMLVVQLRAFIKMAQRVLRKMRFTYEEEVREEEQDS